MGSGCCALRWTTSAAPAFRGSCSSPWRSAGSPLFWLAWRSMRRPFAIVHFHNPPDFLIIAGLLPRAIGCKLILDVHDLSPHMFAIRVPGRGGMLASRVLIWVERLSCALAHQVITVHEPYRAELVKHGVPAAKVRVVMNSADDAVLSRAREAAPLWTARQHSGSLTTAR